MGLTSRLGHRLYLCFPTGELSGAAPSSKPAAAMTLKTVCEGRDDQSTTSSITEESPACVAQEELCDALQPRGMTCLVVCPTFL